MTLVKSQHKLFQNEGKDKLHDHHNHLSSVGGHEELVQCVASIVVMETNRREFSCVHAVVMCCEVSDSE